METYKNLGGNSGIDSYKIEPNAITIKFTKGKYLHYSYTYSSAGKSNIDEMKRLAENGRGLNSFIVKNVKDKFYDKW